MSACAHGLREEREGGRGGGGGGCQPDCIYQAAAADLFRIGSSRGVVCACGCRGGRIDLGYVPPSDGSQRIYPWWSPSSGHAGGDDFGCGAVQSAPCGRPVLRYGQTVVHSPYRGADGLRSSNHVSSWRMARSNARTRRDWAIAAETEPNEYSRRQEQSAPRASIAIEPANCTTARLVHVYSGAPARQLPSRTSLYTMRVVRSPPAPFD